MRNPLGASTFFGFKVRTLAVAIMLMAGIGAGWLVTVFAQTVPAGPIMHLQLNESGGTTASDASGNGNHGTLVNGPVWVVGRSGNALTFDGVNDYVHVPSSASLKFDYDFSSSFWVRTTQTAGRALSSYEGSGDGYYFLRLASGGKVELRVDDGVNRDLVSTASINDGAFHHVAMVRNGVAGTVSLYVDGALQGTITGGTSDFISYQSGQTWLGSNQGTTEFFSGTLDDVVVYSRALTSTEVAELAGGAAPAPGPTDTTPPTASNPTPSGTLAAGTTQATMSVTTNETAFCRYSTASGVAYGSMTSTFTTTGGTSHSQLVTGLTNATNYLYYVRCQDAAGNAMSNDFAVTFSVAAAAGCTPNWQCTAWLVCNSGGTQTRTCTDANACGVTTGKPAESQSCTPQGSGAGPTAVITVLNSPTSRLAPHTVHVHATNSAQVGVWHRAKFEWDFDVDGRESSHLTVTDPRNGQTVDLAKGQQGYNAAYIYRQAGTYTIRLRVTNAAGLSHETTTTVTVAADTRQRYYVDPVSGADSAGRGTAEATPWATFGYAVSQVNSLGGNAAILLKRGSTFPVSSTLRVTTPNVMVDAYGSGARPTLQSAAGMSDELLILAGTNGVMRNIYFTGTGSLSTATAEGVRAEIGAISQTIWDSEFQLFDIAVKLRGTGALLLNNTIGKTNAYNVIPGGSASNTSDVVIVGNTTNHSLSEHTLRALPPGAIRLNASYNQMNKASGESKVIARLQKVQYGTFNKNYFNDQGSGEVIVVSYDSGYTTEGDTLLRYAGTNHITIDANRFDTSSVGIRFEPNSHHVMVRNNIMSCSRGQCIALGNSEADGGSDPTCDSGGNNTSPIPDLSLRAQMAVIEDIDLYSNVFLNTTSNTTPVQLSAGRTSVGPPFDGNCVALGMVIDLKDVRIRNNLTVMSSYFSSVSTLRVGDMADIVSAGNNIWPNFGSFSGVTWTQWQTFTGNTDAQENVAAADIFFPPQNTYPLTTSAGRPVDGVFEDYRGVARDRSTTWVAGAVQSTSGTPAPTCTPNWQCSVWSACSTSGTQTRTCTDANACGVTTGKPVESQSCTATPAPSTKFVIGDRVTVTADTANLNVRATPSLSGTLLGTQALGTLGTITAGPTFADNAWWWSVNYDTGADGWSIEEYLTKSRVITNGSLIKLATDPRVFLIENGSKRWIVDEYTFRTLGYTDSQIIVVTQAEFDSFPTGVNLQLTCTPNWQCSVWSACTSSTQTRTCTDANACGVTTGQPATSQSCSVTPQPTGSECTDGRDNDGDGRVDTADSGCSGLNEFTEAVELPIGMNLDRYVNGGSQNVFADLFKRNGGWSSLNASNGTATSVVVPADADGYPLAIPYDPDGAGGVEPQVVQTTVLATTTNLPGGTYTIFFDGTGSLQVTHDRTTTCTGTGSGTCTFTLAPPTAITLRLLQSQTSDRVRNIRIIMPGQTATYQSQPFDPQLISLMRDISVVRPMTLLHTNNHPCTDRSIHMANPACVIRWSDHKTATYYSQAHQVRDQGVSYEYMPGLANTLNADLWLTVPHAADDDYFRQLAAMVRQRLDAKRKIYLELSNEVWNPGFPQYAWFRDSGLAQYPTLSLTQARIQYYVQRSAAMFTIFEQEFAGQTNRLVNVVGTQISNDGLSDQLLGRFTDPVVNPSGVRPEALAVAGYFGVSVTSAEADSITVDEILNRSQANLTGSLTAWIVTQRAVAVRYGVPLVAYEGGQHLAASDSAPAILTDKFIAANRHPRMRDLTMQLFDVWEANGGGLFTYFLLVKTPTSAGSWGALEWMTQARSQAPKWDAIRQTIEDWQAAAPAPTCTPNWQCSVWSACSTSGTQTRTCTDANACGVTTGKPVESQSCFVDTTAPTVSGLTFTTSVNTAQVTWTTNEPATSVVEYGLTSALGVSISSNLLTTAHGVNLDNLAAATTYYVQVQVTDAAGNRASAPAFTLTTKPAPIVIDTQAPVLTGLAVIEVTPTTATVVFSTNEPAIGSVAFGLTTQYGTTVSGPSTLTTQHRLSLSGLTAATAHHYRASARDASGNTAEAGDLTFVTQAFALDTDGDGIPDSTDLDDDGDTLSDERELALGTNPRSADTDSDTVADGDDRFPLDRTESVDTDGDGMGDTADADDDGDGLPDSTEVALGTDPKRADSDGDGVNDLADAFPTNPSLTQPVSGTTADLDSDRDGLSDSREATLGTDPQKADTDGDGVNDLTDAFPVNRDETTDTDGDGTGDRNDSDDDSDGLSDDTETSTTGTNALKADTDGDGVNDRDDVFPLNPTLWARAEVRVDRTTNISSSEADGSGALGPVRVPVPTPTTQLPTGPQTLPEGLDSDGDGLSDAAEARFGTDASNPDTDGDGFSDHAELQHGFDPFTAPMVKPLSAAALSRLNGRILLLVSGTGARGQAFYIRNGKRTYLRDGAAAYTIMRQFGQGIDCADLAKIPVEGTSGATTSLGNRFRGQILLNVKCATTPAHGEAWRVDPDSGKRTYLKDGEAAYALLRAKGTGATSETLRAIPYQVQ